MSENGIEETPTQQPLIPPALSPLVEFLTEQAIIFLVVLSLLVWQKLIRPRIENLRGGFKRSWQHSQAIRDNLARLQILFDADRVVLAEFTNGNKGSQTSIHYWKLRILQEVPKPGVSKVSSLIGKRTIDISEIPEEIEKITREKCYVLERSPDLPVRCYAHLGRIGTECVVQVLLGSEEKPLGLLSIQYTNKAYKLRDIDHLLKRDSRFFELTTSISAHLTPDPFLRVLFNEVFNRT